MSEVQDYQDALARIEREVGEGRSDLGALGFWRLVRQIKQDPALSHHWAEEVGRVDRAAFERRVRPRLPVWFGNAVLLVGSAVLVALVPVAVALASDASSPEPVLPGLMLLVAAGGLAVTLHDPAHWLVGRLSGIRFDCYFLDGPFRIQPGIKVDYASYLPAAPGRELRPVPTLGDVGGARLRGAPDRHRRVVVDPEVRLEEGAAGAAGGPGPAGLIRSGTIGRKTKETGELGRNRAERPDVMLRRPANRPGNAGKGDRAARAALFVLMATTEERTHTDPLVIAGRTFGSRLIVGTGKFGSFEVMRHALEASGTEMVTVALRRVDLEATGGPDSLEYIDPERCLLLPNSSGAVDADEAVRLAHLARAAGMPTWVKLEVTPEPRYLLPDPVETLRAAERLVADGFTVLPYIGAHPVLSKRLEEVGCATVMPLGSWIGSNRGIRTRDAVRIIVEQATVPVVVDAGLGAPSHAAEAMEMGCDAVLVNTAIAVASDPVEMARAFRLGVEAGRRAFLAGRAPERTDAQASSPLTGFLEKLATSQTDPGFTEP